MSDKLVRQMDWNNDPQALFDLLTKNKKYLAKTYGHSPDYYAPHRFRTKQKLLKEGLDVSEILKQPDGEEQLRRELESRVARGLGKKATNGTVKIEVPEEHLPKFEKLREALVDNGLVTGMRVSDYQMGMKNSEGEFESHDLHAVRFDVKFDYEPQWPTVMRVESVKLPRKEVKIRPDGQKTAVILPDLQIPFHDEAALDIALQVIRDTKPDRVILLGDMLDLSAWGKYEQRPEYATATQASIIKAHQFLATIRKLAPSSQITVLAGNHEARIERALLRNMQAAYGIKRADDVEGWPVVSVPHLCAFDTLDVEYVDAYPASRVWINERLQVRHGNIARPGGKTAVAIANDEKVTTIFGHIHRIEAQYKTVNVFEGGRTSAAFGIGCLCRIDGHVPSTKSAFDSRTQQPVQNFENWQQGLAVVNYGEGDGTFAVQQLYINTFNGHETNFNGKVYRPGVA